jgi:4-azaleucine resistance transporter AzlC
MIRSGVRAALPVCLGYFPLGVAFGVLARHEGLTVWQAGGMSILVFAGSAQYAAVGLLAQGAGTAAIVVATLVLNLRHLLFGAALAPNLTGAGRGFLALFAYGVTDETFAVNAARFRAGGWGPVEALAVNQTSNLAWVGSSILGAAAGDLIPPGAFGIDFALPAMFLGLVVILARGRARALTAMGAGLLALVLRAAAPGNAFILWAAVLAATAGAVIREWVTRRAAGRDGRPEGGVA